MNHYNPTPSLFELENYLHNVTQNPAVFAQRLIPSIRLDYLTLSIPHEQIQSLPLLLDKFMLLDPQCNILDYDEAYARYCKQKKGTLESDEERISPNLVAVLQNKNELHTTVYDTRSKFNVIVKNRSRSEFYKPVSVYLVGPFAHDVLEAPFSGRLNLYDYISSISRTDLKAFLEGFLFENYKKDCNRLEEFQSNQRLFFSHINKGLAR